MSTLRDEAPKVLRQRFNQAYEASNFTSLRQLSDAASLSAPMAQRIISGHYADSRVGPGIFTMTRIAAALDLPLGYFVGEDVPQSEGAQAFFNGTNQLKGKMERLLETHWRGAGRLEAFTNLLDDCDQYAVPKDNSVAPQIVRVGKRTLFAGRLGGPFARDAQNELNAMSRPKRTEILEFHRKIVSQKTAVGNAFLDHAMVTRAVHVRASNARLGLLVTDSKGDESILVHAMPIPV